MIHSKEKSPDEIFKFCDRYKEFEKKVKQDGDVEKNIS